MRMRREWEWSRYRALTKDLERKAVEGRQGEENCSVEKETVLWRTRAYTDGGKWGDTARNNENENENENGKWEKH